MARLRPVSSALLALAILSLTLRLDRVDLRAPLNYLQDANTFQLRAKAIVEGNWIWRNPRVGMPFGADWRDFPMNISLDSALMWLLSRFTHSAPLIVNLEWMIAVALAAALACYAFLELSFRSSTASAFGAIFALLPYTYFRGTRHLHCVDYAVPLIALAAIELVRGSWLEGDRATSWRDALKPLAKIPLYAWIACLVAGLAYAYTAFFAVFVLTAAGAIGFLRRRDPRTLVLAAGLVAALSIVAVLDLSPSLLFWARNGTNAAMRFKSPAEAELYALKVRYLITPVPDHPIPLLSAAEKRLATTKYPLFPNENEWGRLGTIGSLGFLALIVFALAAAVNGGASSWPMAGLMGCCASLTLACVLFGSVGGFGDFFSTFVTPDIRCYTRIFPFIGFFSLAAAAAVISPLDRRIGPRLRIPLWIGIAVLAGYDQAVPGYANDHRQAVYSEDDDFVRSIENVLPENSAVFELPFTDFPNEILPGNLVTNDLLRPYLHSTKYRWSWPAVSGTTPAEWNRMSSSLATPELLRTISHQGFSGLWLDSAGYDAGKSPESAITSALGAEPRRSRDGRFLFYDLRAYSNAIQHAESAMTAGEVLAQNPLQVLFERGFYYEERNAERVWHWSMRRGRITIINQVNIARTVSLSMTIQTAGGGGNLVRISRPGGADRFNAPGKYTLRMDVAPSQMLALDFECDCGPVEPPGSARPLYFYVSDFAMQPVP